MIPPKVRQLCQNGLSISAELAKDPSQPPSHICKKLFHADGHLAIAKDGTRIIDNGTRSDLEQAADCGTWGASKPSDLFLKIYHDVLNTLTTDPLIDVCSPSLIGSNGVCSLVIISTIPDIARHMSNLIARAEREVFLATNFWMFSEPSRLITNALQELSRRAGRTNRHVVVKIMYDRGDLKQFVKNHQSVHEDVYSDPEGKIRLPRANEIPNVDLEVVNFHRPILGTSHAKFMVVDRKIAVLQSNNIQDNDNMEMMCQYEGDIVDSIYDTALITWHNELKPPLQCLDTPARGSKPPSFDLDSHKAIFDETRKNWNSYFMYAETGPTESLTRRDSPHTMPPGANTVSDAAANAVHRSLPQHTSQDPHYDVDIAGEMLRSISALNPREGERRVDVVARHLNTIPENDTKASAPDHIDISDVMSPLIPLVTHDPFPIAVVSRPPFGPPAASSLQVPQNIAWMSALRYAARSVLIQTPDLNATALLPEILACCRRKVKVTAIYCLGYNDAGELLPLQGGHNEGISHSLYAQLEPGLHKYLDYHVYVAKDQRQPIHNSFKRRSCHVKLMVIDDHIGIMGSGNQDTQSWYHSQEVNVMVDSPLVVGKWLEGIRRNQNTFKYGLCRKGDTKEDKMVGCWVDEKGQMAERAIGYDAGRFAWARGAIGAVNRMRGVGGF